jgi:hypothetical protein
VIFRYSPNNSHSASTPDTKTRASPRTSGILSKHDGETEPSHPLHEPTIPLKTASFAPSRSPPMTLVYSNVGITAEDHTLTATFPGPF